MQISTIHEDICIIFFCLEDTLSQIDQNNIVVYCEIKAVNGKDISH